MIKVPVIRAARMVNGVSAPCGLAKWRASHKSLTGLHLLRLPCSPHAIIHFIDLMKFLHKSLDINVAEGSITVWHLLGRPTVVGWSADELVRIQLLRAAGATTPLPDHWRRGFFVANRYTPRPMEFSIHDIDLHVLNMRTRMPFKYGIATLTALPHLFVRLRLDIDDREFSGIAADGLPPKWFTKNPQTHFNDDLADMFEVIRHACQAATDASPATSPFELWQDIYQDQQSWAGDRYPPLLWGLGVSLIERAMVDAYCRATNTTFADALRTNTFGIDLGAMHACLKGAAPRDLLPQRALRRVAARHTVGLADPLTDADIANVDRVTDGLPQSLEACVDAYGLTHFKIKLCGDAQKDIDRLNAIATIVGRNDRYAFTLDGNEQYHEVEPFKQLWQTLTSDRSLDSFLSNLVFVEQPFHRDAALSVDTGRALLDWMDRPPIIIDESDGELNSLPDALRLGYVGTSFKNCKGVFKGIANACLIAHKRKTQANERFEFSGEDLANVGPVALNEDLAVAANLGIEHIERNGHHYFAGLSMLPGDVQQQVLDHHGDLYRRHDRGFPTLNITNGSIAIDSVINAPFGVGIDLDPSQFTPLDEWRPESLA